MRDIGLKKIGRQFYTNRFHIFYLIQSRGELLSLANRRGISLNRIDLVEMYCTIVNRDRRKAE